MCASKELIEKGGQDRASKREEMVDCGWLVFGREDRGWAHNVRVFVLLPRVHVRSSAPCCHAPRAPTTQSLYPPDIMCALSSTADEAVCVIWVGNG